MSIDPEGVAALIAEIAQDEIAARYRRLGDDGITTKTSPTDFVTEADLAAEAALEKALLTLRPDAAFIGEEIASSDASVLDALNGDGAAWIVDPLDGTRNFVQGRDEFGTIVAFVEGGETQMGWIYGIPDNSIMIAEKGGGARFNGEALSTVPAKTENLMGYRAIGNLAPEWKDRIVPKMRATLETEPSRCSAYAYLALAEGARDFIIYSRVYPWDHAAGALMLREIEGNVAYLDDGSTYMAGASQGRPMLAAGSSDVWTHIRDGLLA